jgi:hypothetical protein
MNSYRLNVNSEKTEHSVKAKNPTEALRLLVAAAGLSLASQTGRYGRTTGGHSVSALIMAWSATQYADARTTRV